MNAFYNASASLLLGRQVLRSTTTSISTTPFATSTLGRWTCRQCSSRGARQNIRRGFAHKAGSGNGSGSGSGNVKANANAGKRRVILAAAGAGTLGASTLAFGDDIKHAYEAAERSGRVASTLFVCINE